ncbi:MAG: DinB family protein [Gemmatimonadota bacterium]|jgi:uncharacterized damage-inducible protein DinB|nr:DinB family protein [Gemmatimonadota bacterium]
MPIAETLIPEFDQEMAITRRLLERVPEAGLAWKPHEKSWSLGELATHVATLPSWVEPTLTMDELGFGSSDPPVPALTSTAQIVERFDDNAASARRTIQATPDEEFARPWTLKVDGHPVFTLPKAVVYRSTVLNHLIHHRGQLTVYLRMLDVPLPPVYGPTADEAG